MPKVTDEHRERRRQQILDAARECFVEKGFHQTSMSDVFAASGLSSGAVYGYFKSKDEIIAAIADEVLDSVESILEVTLSGDNASLDQMLRDLLRGVARYGPTGLSHTRLAPQVWSEAGRNRALSEVVRSKYAMMRGKLTTLIKELQEAGSLTDDVPADQLAKVVLSIALGYVVQNLVIGDLEPDSYAESVAAALRPCD